MTSDACGPINGSIDVYIQNQCPGPDHTNCGIGDSTRRAALAASVALEEYAVPLPAELGEAGRRSAGWVGYETEASLLS